MDLPGEMEETIASILRTSPEKLESGLVFRSAEDYISTGKTDLVFNDARGSILIVEVEREATDSAIGQISAPLGRIRKRQTFASRTLFVALSLVSG